MRNIGSADRAIRLFVGVLLLVVGLGAFIGIPGTPAIGSLWHWLALIVGVVMTATALLRVCPAYSLFGLNSCGKDG